MDILLLPSKNEIKEEGAEKEKKEHEPVSQNSDSGCEDSNTDNKQTTEITTSVVTETAEKRAEDTDDIIILKRDPSGKRNLINKTAYVKLHRTISPEKHRVYVGSIKERYENPSENEGDTKLESKQSPTGFGYPKYNHVSPRLPVPKPRSNVKSQIFTFPETKRPSINPRYSLQIDKNSKQKDENSNEILSDSSDSGEIITIIPRSESEASIDKFEKELSLFTMDAKPKDKKRSNSFRKIFSGKMFGKDKKKKNEEELPKMEYRENVSNSVNMQKESNSFNRHAVYRHTTGSLGSIPRETRMARRSEQLMQDRHKVRELEEHYARMNVQEFNHIKQNFENQRPKPPAVDYLPVDNITANTQGPTNYNKYIESSSSTSTAELDENNPYPSNTSSRRRDSRGPLIVAYRDKSRDRSRERSRERSTPPRAQDTRPDIKLVNPKAIIPINSERALPIPYQNRSYPSLEKPKTSSNPNIINTRQIENNPPRFEETYGIVFDSLEKQQVNKIEKFNSENSLRNSTVPKSPTKLKLPPNRDIVPLSPRVTSPIPHDNVSTDKIIATELLKPRSPSPNKKSYNTRSLSPSHQRLEVGIDYPDNISNEQNERNIVTSKPPISRMPVQRQIDSWSPSRQRISQNSPAFEKMSSQSSLTLESHEDKITRHRMSQASPVGNIERTVTGSVVHVNSNTRTPTPNSIPQNRSLSPITITPTDLRPPSVCSLSPQKEDMRRSVEAFYWREIKKLKDQENMDLFYYQMNMMPSNYAEEPISMRRSRSMSPTSHRNSRRSLSLPRDPKPSNRFVENTENHNRIQRNAIPEGRPMIHQMNVPVGQSYQQQQFRRNVPERQTVDNMPRLNGNYNSLYRPIFKRGSLTTPLKEVDDFQNKKVSFSNHNAAPQNLQALQMNGFQYNLQQGRNINLEAQFLQQQNNPNMFIDSREVYGYANRPNQNMHPQQQQFIMPANYPNVNYRQQVPRESLYSINSNSNVFIRPQEDVYGPARNMVRAPFGIARHGSMQLSERPQMLRKMSYDNHITQPRAQVPSMGHQMPRREIIVQDEIFGQFGGYIQHEDPYGYSRRQPEPMYGYSQQPKQVSVNNRVCDMYGQIHDGSNPSLAKNSGVILGQIRNSPQVTRHLSQENFQRNTRLTSSANDMYLRYTRNDYFPQNPQLYQEDTVVSSRPLPPVPMKNQSEDKLSSNENSISGQKKDKHGKPKKRFFFGGC